MIEIPYKGSFMYFQLWNRVKICIWSSVRHLSLIKNVEARPRKEDFPIFFLTSYFAFLKKKKVVLRFVDSRFMCCFQRWKKEALSHFPPIPLRFFRFVFFPGCCFKWFRDSALLSSHSLDFTTFTERCRPAVVCVWGRFLLFLFTSSPFHSHFYLFILSFLTFLLYYHLTCSVDHWICFIFLPPPSIYSRFEWIQCVALMILLKSTLKTHFIRLQISNSAKTYVPL